MGPNPEGHGLNCTQKEEIMFKSVACVVCVRMCVCVVCEYTYCVCVTQVGVEVGGCSCRGQTKVDIGCLPPLLFLP